MVMITPGDREYLRELAKRQREIAHLPIMRERARLWRRHNALAGERPMIVMEEQTFLGDLLPPARCGTEQARWMERQLQTNIAVHELIDDDKVTPAFFAVPLQIRVKLLGQEFRRVYASGGGSAYHIEPVLETLSEDMGKLTKSTFTFDAEADRALCALAEDTLGDILPLKRVNAYNCWSYGLTQTVVNLMGMESMYCAMLEEEEDFHRLMALLVEDRLACLEWQRAQGLLLPNGGNDYMGSGSYCFTDELPAATPPGGLRSQDLWGHLNSQESVGISPGMFTACIYPYYARLAEAFGLVYFGCCEPVHPIWESLKALPNLRKVSISPWCDEDMMAERLRGGRVIYSRKPSPNFLGVEAALDEGAFLGAMRHTARLTRDCPTEVIFRDIYALHGNVGKVGRAVALARQAFGGE